MASIQFLGAAGTVTGSKFLLEHEGKRVLIDCGLFQGRKEWRLRNWSPLPVEPKSIDAVVLTHAHIDHTGGLPRLVKDGFHGPVYCTHATADLLELLLPDSAQLQEEEARYANAHHYSKHSPALPLYEEKDAQAALRLLKSFRYQVKKEIVPGVFLTFTQAGHILGSAICTFELTSTNQHVVFTGDLGRYNAPILKDPQTVSHATTLVAESTYGDREHNHEEPGEKLAQIVTDTARRGGVLLVPAFAIGRTQELLYHLNRLENSGRIPQLPVFVDSPMACDATPIYLNHAAEHDLDMQKAMADGSGLYPKETRFTRKRAESREINKLKGPGIILSASGMATGGRILHHLTQRLPNPDNTVLFVGYQAEGTRGRRLLNNEPEIKIHGRMVPVRAKIQQLSGFSAHADFHEMLRWMDGFTHPPKQTLLVHGEPDSLESLRQKVSARGWPVSVPKYLEKVELI